ncbi:MAG: hypothetical protein QW292_14900 [Candidatus Parvarchaeota archaeon]
MTSKGTAAEGILLKMLLQRGIEAEHGSPSSPGDIIVPPNVIIEVKDPKANSYSFKQHSGKGEAQWKALKAKKEAFPWLDIYYVVRFERKEWKFFSFPDTSKPLRMQDGLDLGQLFSSLLEKQNSLMAIVGGVIQ